jgi:hypothetical protein
VRVRRRVARGRCVRGIGRSRIGSGVVPRCTLLTGGVSAHRPSRTAGPCVRCGYRGGYVFGGSLGVRLLRERGRRLRASGVERGRSGVVIGSSNGCVVLISVVVRGSGILSLRTRRLRCLGHGGVLCLLGRRRSAVVRGLSILWLVWVGRPAMALGETRIQAPRLHGENRLI